MKYVWKIYPILGGAYDITVNNTEDAISKLNSNSGWDNLCSSILSALMLLGKT